MKMQLLQNGQVIQQFYTFNSGGYSFKVDSLSTYTVGIDTTALPLSLVCPVSGIRVASLSVIDSLEVNENFGMQCSASDFGMLYISGNHFRASHTTQVNIGAGNIVQMVYNADCGAASSGTVTTSFTGSAQYMNPAPGALTPSSVSGNVLTYNVSDLDSLYPGSLDIILVVDTGAIVGSSVCITSIVSPTIPDMNPADDTLTQCFTIVNSWDPNLKQVYPTGNIDTGAAQWLTYTINFQNTGTDTAYLVVVKDTLSPDVDASSFQYLASNSKVVIQLFGKVCVFTFPKINLPDSAVNPQGSQGWIQYKVKTLPGLPINTQVRNTAYIYFDLNPAVVTNTTVNVVDTPTHLLGIRQIANAGLVHLYPNPNHGSFTLETTGNIGSEYTISDMLGNVIEQKTLTSNTQAIDLPQATEGVYTIVIKGTQPVRFVIMR
jgi:uncharacterized repeat protein (TIGR01451 family)